jgi:flagellar biosynthesis chaperone FliJ
MWRELVDYGKRIFSLQRTVDHHGDELKETRDELREMRQELKEMQRELRALVELVREYRSEQRLDRAMTAKDMENLVLRL